MLLPGRTCRVCLGDWQGPGRCPLKAKRLWSLWQALLLLFLPCLTRPGFRRFAEWLTGLVLNDAEHTLTQSLVGLARTQDGKAREAFAAYGAGDRDHLERLSAR